MSFFKNSVQKFKGYLRNLIKKYGLKDPVLIAALAIGVLFALPGFSWGKYDCLNLDRMAFRGIFSENRRPFEPSSYVKPPFYTYINHFAAVLPAKFFRNLYFFGDKNAQAELFLRLRTSFSRSLNIAFFALCTAAIFVLARSAYSLWTARIASLLFASSCGFIPYQIFLTTDLAVVFMMMASFLFAVKIIANPNMFNSVTAGILAGLACATKYNGLAVAAALPVAHILAGRGGNLLFEAVKRKSAWICGLCVPLGFIIGNPYSIIDWKNFKSDFIYNYSVTPVYNGFSSGTGYSKFFQSFYEIFGVPGTWLAIICCSTGIIWIFRNKNNTGAANIWLLASAVFAFYAYKIGSFPRIETRFVIPAAPFLVIITFSGIEAYRNFKVIFTPIIAGIVAFNLLCGFYISRLFAEDPRNVAIDYYKKYLKEGFVMEYSESLPKPEALNVKGKCMKMQMGLERVEKFREMFKKDENLLSMVEKKENQVDAEWFSIAERKKRGTDFVIWSTIDLEGIIQKHYEILFDESNGYKKIYDASSPATPDWVYPKNTEFLRNRTTIWVENWKS